MKVDFFGMTGYLGTPEEDCKGAILMLHGRTQGSNQSLFRILEDNFDDYFSLRPNFTFAKTGKVSEDLSKELKEATEMTSFLLRRAGRPAKDCILVGKSLGAIIASKLAGMYKFKGVALLGYPLHEADSPTAWFPQEHFAKIRSPILMVTGDKDRYCNASMARALKQKSKNQLDLVIVDNATHNFTPTIKKNTLQENESYVSKVVRAWADQL